MKIGLFDSGKGGTTILAAVKTLLPNEEYYFVADSDNCPYGEKSDQELQKIVSANVDELQKWGAEIVVVACNTATTRCINYLRNKYPDLKFVGTEPAIKLATSTDAKNILVMATPGTIKSEQTLKLVEKNQKPGQNIKLLACPGLADAIENDENIDEVLDRILADEGDYNLVVLGCTHYSLIKPQIQKYFLKAKLIDGHEGVAHRVKELVE